MNSSRIFAVTMSILAIGFTSCSRKAPQAGPPAPEVLVTTVQPRDVPRVIERVATLDGFINCGNPHPQTKTCRRS